MHDLKSELSKLIIFRGLVYIFTKQSPQPGSSEKRFFQALTVEGSETSFSMNRLQQFLQRNLVKTIVLSSISQYPEVAPTRSGTVETNTFRFKSGGMEEFSHRK